MSYDPEQNTRTMRGISGDKSEIKNSTGLTLIGGRVPAQV